MSQEYIKKMRDSGHDDQAIKKELKNAGWNDREITEAMAEADGQIVPPPPPHATTSTQPSTPQQPLAVVQRYTTVGMEFAVMFVALAIGAVSLGGLLHDWVDQLLYGKYVYGGDFSLSSWYGIAAMVTIPIFLVLFFRLKRMEQSDPLVHNDSSRRRGVQLVMLVAFVWGIKSVIFYLYYLLNPAHNDYDYYASTSVINNGSVQLVQILHLIITLGIAGAIFTYYWVDEHRQKS